MGTGKPGARAAIVRLLRSCVRVDGLAPVARTVGLSERSLAALLSDPSAVPEGTWSSLGTGLQDLGERLV